MATARNINNIQSKVGDWVVSIQYTPWSDGVNIWFAHKMLGKQYICRFTKDGQMEMSEFAEGITPEPTMKISGEIWEGIRQAISGVEETPQKQAVDSELKATRFHLEDMRKIVFKK